MRIAITTLGRDLDSEIDPRFGRAQYLLIVDPEGTIAEVIDNEPNRAAMGGAGIAAAKILADRKVNVLLTGRCGPNALAALRAAGIEIGEVQSGTARQALEKFNLGEVSRVKVEDAGSEAVPRAGALGAQGAGGGRGMGFGRGMGRGMGRGRGRGRGPGR